MVEHLILGWKNIHELLKTEDGDQLLCLRTLVTEFGPDLKRVGAVFPWYKGKSKRKVMACWPSIFKQWFTILQQKKYKEKGLSKQYEKT